jgi:hypothetical protein
LKTINDLWSEISSRREKSLLKILFDQGRPTSLFELERELRAPHSTLYGKKGLISRLEREGTIRVAREKIGRKKTRQVASLTPRGAIKAIGYFGSELNLQKLRSYDFTEEDLKLLEALGETLPNDAIKQLFRIAYYLTFYVRKDAQLATPFQLAVTLATYSHILDKEKLEKLLKVESVRRYLEQVMTTRIGETLQRIVTEKFQRTTGSSSEPINQGNSR